MTQIKHCSDFVTVYVEAGPANCDGLDYDHLQLAYYSGFLL